MIAHRCLRGRFAGGRLAAWEFEKDGEILRVDPKDPLISQPGSASDLLIQAAVGGLGLVGVVEDWMRAELDSGALEPVLEDCCPLFGALPLLRGAPLSPRPIARLRRLRKASVIVSDGAHWPAADRPVLGSIRVKDDIAG
jgi:hypothetical protein